MFSTHIHTSAPEGSLPANVALCPGAGLEPDMCASVSHAEAAFARLFPGCDFFPPLPDDAGADSDDDVRKRRAPWRETIDLWANAHMTMHWRTRVCSVLDSMLHS